MTGAGEHIDLVEANNFFARCRDLGIAPDEQYSEPRCLVYLSRRRHARFWEVPARAAQVPFFVAHLLAGGGEWSHCHVWPRGGAWPRDDVRLPTGEDEPADRVRRLILGGAGVPSGYQGAVRYGREELGRLVAAVFAQVVFGWTVSDDLFVIPDHGRMLLHTDHHDVVHVEFAEEGIVGPFKAHMAREVRASGRSAGRDVQAAGVDELSAGTPGGLTCAIRRSFFCPGWTGPGSCFGRYLG